MLSRITIAFLCILLVASNIFWLYSSIDSGVTRAYINQNIYEMEHSNKQALGILKILLHGKSKDEIQDIAQTFTDLEPFEKEGCLWVGWYGFKFSDAGNLTNIEATANYNENSVCNANL